MSNGISRSLGGGIPHEGGFPSAQGGMGFIEEVYMRDLNMVVLEGNLTAAPLVKAIGDKKTPLAEFTLGTNKRWKDGNEYKESASFIFVKTFDKSAEIAAEHGQKGRRLRIEGELKQETWKDKASGENRSRIVVVARTLDFGPPKTEAQASEPTPEAEPAAAQK